MPARVLHDAVRAQRLPGLCRHDRTLVNDRRCATLNNLDNIASFGGTGRDESREPWLALRQPTRSAVGLQQPGQRGERIRRVAKPASRRREFALRRRFGPFHEEHDQRPDLGQLGSINGGEVVSSDQY